ncbi:hypothetical protein [Streptomyces sp. NBC_00847]|uniref:hypothetical protein n=1 Tax=Streptomyces sp. NBC_00847 TaxID=2975850 RepID=UPI00225E4EBC|nr:hypothetical protein [Streptomyces sp. NBC_00847]MCX4885924.1 hypothetical protein [Streptomyces sp. NBC_00847]
MNDQTGPPRLTRDQLSELLLADEQQRRAPDTAVPLPDCFLCGRPATGMSSTLGCRDVDERVVTLRPCGHRLAFNVGVAERMQAKMGAAAGPASAPSEVGVLRAEVAAARRFAGEMREFCSPHGVSVHYADQLEAAMDRAKEGAA